MIKLLHITSLLAILTYCLAETCRSPKVTTNSFTTQDATIVTSIAYIAEFTVKCDNGLAENLYALLEGNVVPVSVVGPHKFQVSWTEDIKSARSGDRTIRIFDEEGYTLLRKAFRAEEDVSSIPSLFDVTVNHPGAYNGPWLKSELFATIVSLIVAYFAVSFKSKVTV